MKSAPSAALEYPRVAAFDPRCACPEYLFAGHHVDVENSLYGAVRDTVCLAGLDASRLRAQRLGLDIRNQRVLRLSHHRLAALDLPLVLRSDISETHGGTAKASYLGFRPHPARAEYFA